MAKTTLQQELNACAEAAKGGALAVIVDFDRTLTRCFLPNGDRGSSAHGVLEKGGVLSEPFCAKTKELFNKYYPIEIDATMSIEEKIPIMSEWYGQVHSLMLDEGITRSNLQAAVASCQSIQLRDGMEEFLRSCQEARPPVPVLIMSAGLGDVIEEFLRKSLTFALAPTTLVVSNRLQFDAQGRICGFSEPLLHMFNKTAAFLDASALRLVEGCRKCLVLGDGVGDATMADGLEGVSTLKIGFLNEKIEERQRQYNEVFDIVVVNDAPVPDVCFQAIALQRTTAYASVTDVAAPAVYTISAEMFARIMAGGSLSQEEIDKLMHGGNGSGNGELVNTAAAALTTNGPATTSKEKKRSKKMKISKKKNGCC